MEAKTTAIRELRVIADTAGYEAGVQRMTRANSEASTSAAKLNQSTEAIATATDKMIPKLSQAGDAAERLRRAFVPGAADAAKLQRAYESLKSEMSRGKLSAEEYAMALDGAIRRHGTEASTAIIAARGHTELATAIEQSTMKLKQQAVAAGVANQNILASNKHLIDSTAQYRKQNLGYQLMDIGQTAALGAPLGMIAAQQGPQIAQIYASQGGMKALIADLGGIAKAIGPAVAAVGAFYGTYKILEANSAEARLAVDGVTKALAAQAAPVSSLQGSVRDLQQVQKAYNDALLATASSQNAATQSVLANVEREFAAKKALLELEMRRQEAAIKLQESLLAIEQLHLRQDIAATVTTRPDPVAGGYADPKIGSVPFVRLPDEMTGVTKTLEQISKSPAAEKIAEMTANLELQRLAVDKLKQGLDLAFTAGSTLIEQGENAYQKGKAYTDAMLKVQQYWHQVYNPPNVSLDKVPTPSPRPENGFPKIDENSEKSLSAYEQMMKSTDQRIAQLQHEAAISGQSASVQARLRVEYELISQAQAAAARDGRTLTDAETAAIRKKAEAIAALNQQSAARGLLDGQRNEIESLQLEAQLIGASTEERARATAVLQAEQQLRQQGINLLSQEGQQYIANAQAIAQARLEIERQNAAYASLQQAGGSAIDSLVTGTGSLKDRMKSAAQTMVQWFEQMAVANPLKNAVFGSNLPTITDLFSGRPSVPGATSTSMMTVTASTVMINGSPIGGLPGALPGVPGAPGTHGTLGGLLGYAPANGNVPSSPTSKQSRRSKAGPMPAITGRSGRSRLPVTGPMGDTRSWARMSDHGRSNITASD